jgi:hypothetical protein
MNNPLPVSPKNIIITVILFLVFSLGCTLLAAENPANAPFYSESEQKIIKMQQNEIERLKQELAEIRSTKSVHFASFSDEKDSELRENGSIWFILLSFILGTALVITSVKLKKKSELCPCAKKREKLLKKEQMLLNE